MEFHQLASVGYSSKDKPAINTSSNITVIPCFFIGLSLVLFSGREGLSPSLIAL
jgi:hypothetical protein